MFDYIYKTKYQVSRKAKKKPREIVKVKQEIDKYGEFSEHFSYPVPPQSIAVFSTSDYMALESRTSISKEIMNALATVDVSMVGVYGDGGVGKTRLAKEVARQAMEEKLIDYATVVTVTQVVNVENIQGQIADILGLRLQEESVVGRAARLFGRLKDKDNAKNDEKILIVFDDLWEKLELGAIGIPSDMQCCRGCKILLTSRDIDVLKVGMNCKKNFRVRTLDKDETWRLFQKMAENSFENDDRQSTAVEVAEMCAGLPVAIVTVASALRNKSLQEWKDALQRLKHPYSEDPSEIQTAIYQTIKFSYDYLSTDELRSTFLLCSQMGYHATTKDLLKYGIGRSLFRNVSKLKEAQDRVFSLVQKLKAMCLLLEGETSEELVMRDVVREAGRWIAASMKHKVLIVNDENLMKQLVDHEDKLKTYSEIWLSSNIDKLPEEIQCPMLALFHVDSKNPTLKIPDKLFIGMRQLTILSFSGLSFPSLSSSFDSLRNLKTLCIHKSPELGDVSMVGKLWRLEVLSFVKSMIRHLPIEIGELSKLKLLDLSDCTKLIAIPPSVLSKLSQLEGLHMGNSFDGWGSSEGGVTSANVSELKQLTSLTSLDIGIRDARPISACREIFSNKKLCTYRISIGYLSWNHGGNKISKALKLKFTDDTNDVGMEELGVMELLKESEEVCFDGLKGVKDFICELDKDRRGFPKLMHLRLHESPEIQCVLDHSTSEVAVDPFPMLEALVLGELDSLKNICRQGRLMKTQPFRKLKFIKVSRCTRLKYLFSFFVAQGLSQLLEIKVEECDKIEEIVAEEEDSVTRSGACTNKNIVFSQLQSLSLGSLPKFKSFCSKEKLEDPSSTQSRKIGEMTPIPVFDEEILFPNLKELFLTTITCEVLWSGHLQLPTIGISFQKLIELRVTDCHELKYLFPATLVKCLGGLKKLEMIRCYSMEEVVLIVGRMEEQIVFPSLKELSIHSCRALKSFTSSSCEDEIFFDETVTFPNLIELDISRIGGIDKIWHRLTPDSFCKLRELRIFGCNKLRNIFSKMGRLQNLEKLNVEVCDSLQVIFEVDDEGWTRESNHGDRTVLPISFHLKVLNLIELPKLRHIWSFCCKDPSPPGGRGTDPYDFSNLQWVDVSGCDALENVFPRSIATHLPKLNKLHIYKCLVLEEIVAKGEEINNGNAAAAPCFRFPELTIVELQEVPKLRRWYPGKHTSEFPKLKVLATPAKNFPKLVLDWNDTMEDIRRSQVQADFFRQLEVLEITGFPDDYEASPSLFLERFPNLENLKISNALFKEIVICEETDDEDTNGRGALKNLRNLSLCKLPKLVHFANPGSILCSILRSLKSLEVSDCGILGPLVPPTTSFQCLQTLEISRCHQVLHLITSSVAKSLVLLTSMSITECKNIEQVAVDEENEAENKVIFEKLKRLELHSLPNLLCFSLWNCAFIFPALEEVCIRECPKMKIFSQGDVRTPKLGRVLMKEGQNKWCWKGSLNATIQKLFMDQVVLQSNLPSLPKQLDMYDETAQPGTLNDQENPTQNEDSSTAKDFENGTFFQEQKSPRAIHQDETIPTSSIEQSLTIPVADVAPKGSSSASTSATKTSNSQPGKTLIDTETCILPQTKEENPTQNQNSSTAKDIESGTFLQAEKGPQSITVQSVPAAAATVAPKVPSSSSATKTPHSQPVKCLIDTETYILPQTKESKPLQDQAMTSSMIENSSNIPISLAATTSEPDQRTPHFEEDYLESLIFNLEQLFNPSPALSSSSEPDTHHPSQTIGDNFKPYIPSMTLMKYIVTKDLSDVATSDDAIFLLTSLKTLKECPSLTPEELEIIELYIKNFDSLVTNYPFHKQQLGMASALKSSSMEDEKKGILDLKMECEEVASEANTLCAEKEALKKRLLEIEDRELKIFEKKGNLYGQLLSRKGKLETRMNALKEAARLQNEAEDRISNANHQWVKMKSLFP